MKQYLTALIQASPLMALVFHVFLITLIPRESEWFSQYMFGATILSTALVFLIVWAAFKFYSKEMRNEQ